MISLYFKASLICSTVGVIVGMVIRPWIDRLIAESRYS